jgi:hypothetical protein
MNGLPAWRWSNGNAIPLIAIINPMARIPYGKTPVSTSPEGLKDVESYSQKRAINPSAAD